MLLFIVSLFTMLLSGCASNPINTLSAETFIQPTSHPIYHHTHAHYHNHCHKKLLAHPYRHTISLKKPLKNPIKIGQSTPLLTDGFAMVQYQSYQQPIIQTTPFQITVIQLEPGEKFTNISSGDPTRWSYAVATSGKEDGAQQNILVKPSLSDISTNLVITTDKRLYNVRLVSVQTDKPTRNIRFSYPEEKINSENDQPLSLEEASIEDPTNFIPIGRVVHDHYSIMIGGLFKRPPTWQPVRVFDDGIHTYIQFSNSIRQRDLPVLFILDNGQKECVNYRFKAPLMIVDKIFDEATLVTGVGRSQQAVILTNLSDEEV